MKYKVVGYVDEQTKEWVLDSKTTAYKVQEVYDAMRKKFNLSSEECWCRVEEVNED